MRRHTSVPVLLSLVVGLGTLFSMVGSPVLGYEGEVGSNLQSQPESQRQFRATELLPPSIVLYAEINDPKLLLSTVWDHPYRQRIQKIDEVQTALQSPQALQAKAGLAMVEAQLGMPWRKAVEGLTGAGIHAAVDANSQAGLVLIHADDRGTLDKAVETLLNIARNDAREKNRPDQIEEKEYRGFKGYSTGPGSLVVFDDWLLLTNKSSFAKLIVDRYADGQGRSLEDVREFADALKTRPENATAWAYVNLYTLRAANMPEGLFAGRTDNPGAELLFGGLMSTFKQTPYATLAVNLTGDRVAATFSLPHQADWVEAAREFYFGPGGAGQAPALVQVPDTLFSLSTYRDISQMWLHAGDLFNENMNDQLAAADSNLSTLFAGRDFGEEILGALAPQVQLIATQQKFLELPKPAIKLPAFALIFQLKDADKRRDEFRRTFQSLVGFLNVVGAMQGNPQLDLETRREDGVVLLTSKYVPEADEEESTTARIQYNFTPAAAFSGDRMIVSSSTVLAEQLVRASAEPAVEKNVNTRAHLDLQVLAKVLSDNREQLVTNNMLEKGHGRDAAENEIGVLLAIVGALQQANLQLAHEDGHLQLNLELQAQQVE